MSAGNPDWLRDHTDAELLTLAREMEARAEEFTNDARLVLNDELRRRRLTVVSYGRARH